MSERCLCGCMDRRDRFGTFDLCPLAEAWFERQQESEDLLRVVADALVDDCEREAT